MSRVVVRIDKKGRLVIPKKLREELKIEEGGYVELSVDEGRIVITPAEPAADRFFSAFKVEKWPEDLDRFLAEEVAKRWSEDM